MWLLLSTIILFLVFCLTIYFSLIYLGIFEDIDVRVGSPPYPFGAQLIAYKKSKSNYSDASALFTEVCSLTTKMNTFGVYLDEPTDDNKDNCRFLVGVLLKPDLVDYQQQKQLLESKGYLFGQLPDVDHVVSTVFPFRSFLSVVIAIKRVYPIIKSYIVEHNLCAHPGIEVYDENNIYFMFPLAKQIQFYQLYGDNDDEDESTDDTEEEEADEPEEEKVIDEKVEVTGTHMRLRSSKSKKSSNSSTSSSFEELIADECLKDS